MTHQGAQDHNQQEHVDFSCLSCPLLKAGIVGPEELEHHLIAICPVWRHRLGLRCKSVGRDNTGGSLVHELIHLYLQSPTQDCQLGFDEDPEQEMALRDVVMR